MIHIDGLLSERVDQDPDVPPMLANQLRETFVFNDVLLSRHGDRSHRLANLRQFTSDDCNFPHLSKRTAEMKLADQSRNAGGAARRAGESVSDTSEPPAIRSELMKGCEPERTVIRLAQDTTCETNFHTCCSSATSGDAKSH